MKLGLPETFQLSIEIGEIAALQQGIVGEVDARRHVLRHERDLLGLGEEIVRHAVEHEAADRHRRQNLFRNDLCRIEHVEVKTVCKLLVEKLQVQLPFRKVSGLDRIPQVAPVEIGVGAVDLYGFVPDHRLHAELRLPDEFDEGGFVLSVHQPERMYAKPLHEAKGARDGAVGHDPHDHVHQFRRETDEIPEIIVCRLRLRERAIGLRLHRMDDVRELDGVLDEEHRDVVADEIPVALLGVELDCEAANVASEVERSFRSCHSREAHENGCLLARTLEDVGAGICSQGIVGLEKAVRAVAARVHNALRDAFVVKMEDFLPEVEIFDERRSPLADLQSVLVVSHRAALSRRQDLGVTLGDLMKFPSFPARQLLIMDRRGLARGLSSGLGHANIPFWRNGTSDHSQCRPKPLSSLCERPQFLFEGRLHRGCTARVCGLFENGHRSVWNRCLGRAVVGDKCEDNL